MLCPRDQPVTMIREVWVLIRASDTTVPIASRNFGVNWSHFDHQPVSAKENQAEEQVKSTHACRWRKGKLPIASSFKLN